MTLYVEAVNASRDGMLLRTANPHLAGRRFRVSFADPSTSEEVAAVVEAVWVQRTSSRKRSHLGLKIVNFLQGAERYEAFVTKHYDDYLQHASVTFGGQVA